MNYCGSLVQGRITKPTFKCKKSKPVEKEKWIIVEDTHEAIISRAHFKAIERMLEIETRIPPSQKMVYPLSGMVRCGKCGGKMIRKVKSNKYGTYHYLICSNKLPRDKWIIIENTHEAIVSEELFNKTKSKKAASRKGVELGTTLFSGKVVCGCCGRNYYTWSKNHVLFCQTPTLTEHNPGCYDQKIHEDELIALIDEAIKFVMLNSKEKIAKYKDDVTTSANELGAVKRELQIEVGRLDRLKVKKEKLFQKLMDNQISDDEYMKLSDEVEREQIIVEDKIRELKKKQKTVLAAKKEKETTVKTYKEIGAIKKIDRNVVDKLINKMIVSKEGRVELHWNFKNIFAC